VDRLLLYGDTESARNAVHLVFSGERVNPNQTMENPQIAPERKLLLGGEVMVIPVADLLRMKLSAWRLKDQVHVQGIRRSRSDHAGNRERFTARASGTPAAGSRNRVNV